MENLREKERNHNLDLVREGQQEYKGHHRRDEWKTWVVNYVARRSKVPITQKSLTRWVNSGEQMWVRSF